MLWNLLKTHTHDSYVGYRVREHDVDINKLLFKLSEVSRTMKT
jgi:hypothetical protein